MSTKKSRNPVTVLCRAVVAWVESDDKDVGQQDVLFEALRDYYITTHARKHRTKELSL